MQTRQLKLIFAFALLFITACSDSASKFSALPPDAVILAFGDSLTAGYGAQKNQSYPAQLQNITGLTVINAGISGEISGLGLKRLPGLLEKYQPDLVIICHGGNDILRKLNLNDTRSNIEQMIHLSRSHQANVMLLAVPKPSLLLTPLPFYQQIAETTGVIFDATTMPEVLKTRDFKSDTIHPNTAGYAEISRRIADQLISVGLIKSDS